MFLTYYILILKQNLQKSSLIPGNGDTRTERLVNFTSLLRYRRVILILKYFSSLFLNCHRRAFIPMFCLCNWSIFLPLFDKINGRNKGIHCKMISRSFLSFIVHAMNLSIVNICCSWKLVGRNPPRVNV